MRVIDLVNKADANEVSRLYNEEYNKDKPNKDGWGSVKSFNEFKQYLNDTVGIRGGDEQFEVTVQSVTDTWKDSTEEYISVGGRPVNNHDQIYSLSMTDWGEWKEMVVVDLTNKNLSDDELIMHVYYEMTWFGWPSKMEETRDNIMDQVEQIKKDFADYKQGDPLPEGYHDMSEIFDKSDDED